MRGASAAKFAAPSPTTPRRDVEQPAYAFTNHRQRLLTLGSGLPAAGRPRNALRHQAVDLSFISAMSGEITSASDDSDFGLQTSGPAHQRRQLEAQRLAAAGGQDDDGVAAGGDGFNGFALLRAKRRVAPILSQQFVEHQATVSGFHCRPHARIRFISVSYVTPACSADSAKSSP